MCACVWEKQVQIFRATVPVSLSHAAQVPQGVNQELTVKQENLFREISAFGGLVWGGKVGRGVDLGVGGRRRAMGGGGG